MSEVERYREYIRELCVQLIVERALEYIGRDNAVSGDTEEISCIDAENSIKTERIVLAYGVNGGKLQKIVSSMSDPVIEVRKGECPELESRLKTKYGIEEGGIYLINRGKIIKKID